MAIQTALAFINHLRQDEKIRHRVSSLSNMTLDAVVELAEEIGYVFSAEDFRIAFKHDWGMRWLKYADADYDSS